MAIAGFQKVGVIGSGQMGSGIAQVCASFGLDVILVDIQQVQLDKAQKGIQASLEKLESKGVLPPGTSAKQIGSRLSFQPSLSALNACDIVIEAVSENEALKTKIFR